MKTLQDLSTCGNMEFAKYGQFQSRNGTRYTKGYWTDLLLNF